MYQILLVDDELPALRFLETIITKYTPAFTVAEQLRDGASALAWLKEHPSDADVLITDIRMPDMDGIALAKAARVLRKDLHIVIVSGYSEFEYAHGAIEASVDDYLLKPVSVSHMRELLDKIRHQLDSVRENRIFPELTALLKNAAFDKNFLCEVFGNSCYYCALLRYGNVIYPQAALQTTRLTRVLPLSRQPDSDDSAKFRSADSEEPLSLSTIAPDRIYCLAGRDNMEFLLFTMAGGSALTFHQSVRQIADNSGYAMVTVVFGQSGMEITMLGTFYAQASKLLRHTAIIGHYHESFLTLPRVSDDTAYLSYDSRNAVNDLSPSQDRHDSVSDRTGIHVSPTVLKRLELNVSESNHKDILKIFKALGKEWDHNQITQRQAYVMMQQLLHLVEAARLEHWKDTDQGMTESDMLTNTASSYQELLENLYGILYNPEQNDLKQRSPEDMYQYAILTIQKKFNQPISIQTVCSEIGISQTYLSRLFRKYGETSFNSCLVQCRINNARKLLEDHPDMPLHQIAVCVGYDDYAYFSKVFRQVTGVSPSQYQSALRQK